MTYRNDIWKECSTNNDMIQSKYVFSYVGEYVRKITVWENKYLTTCTIILSLS